MIYAYVAGLSVIDIACTYIGFTKGFIAEANPLISGVYEKEPLIVSFGILVLIIGCLYAISKSKRVWVRYMLKGILVVKVCIVLLHADWIMRVV